MQIPNTMKAVAVDEFGGPDALSVHTIPVPEIGPNDVLIKVATAGVGVWDPWDREGELASMMDEEPKFPYVLGSDGAGIVAAVGSDVTRFREGDRVYAYGELDPRSRFYAEYAVVREDKVAEVPEGLELREAGAMATDAITALCGLEKLDLERGETLLVFGASGGVGHLAVQLAKRMGLRVLAVASGEDGVELVRSLGADASVDGHGGDIAAAADELAPEGIDAGLFTAGGDGVDDALRAIADGGRVAYPNGVTPEPEREGIESIGYDGKASRERLEKLNTLIESGPFEVHVARTYELGQARDAHEALDGHFLGKLALDVSEV